MPLKTRKPQTKPAPKQAGQSQTTHKPGVSTKPAGSSGAPASGRKL